MGKKWWWRQAKTLGELAKVREAVSTAATYCWLKLLLGTLDWQEALIFNLVRETSSSLMAKLNCNPCGDSRAMEQLRMFEGSFSQSTSSSCDQKVNAAPGSAANVQLASLT